MSADAVWLAFASGTVGAGTIILPVLAVALAYAHGRYVPLWLPDLGTVGAYLARMLWAGGAAASVSLVAALAASAFVAWAIHRFLVARFLDDHDYLSPLLLGLGLAFMFQGCASLMGSGLSEHFPANGLKQQWYATSLGFAVHASDVAGLAVGILISVGMYVMLRSSHLGLRVRAVMANRDWARSLGLPVRRVDMVIVAASAALTVAGACLYGNRFDIQPTMMLYPGLTAIAAAVTVGFFRPFLAVPVACALAIGETMTGLEPSLAHLQRAVPFVVVVLVLVARSALRPGTLKGTP